ncbi:MAG: GDSL-type esterase/lipase family protein [Clostridia bacterium]|nr:GDSL-type esterase/lipase family protein [Clostridia bacterium]
MSDYIDKLYLSGQEIPIRDEDAQRKLGVLDGNVSTLKSTLEDLKTATAVEKYTALAASNPRTKCAVQYYATTNEYAFFETQAFNSWNSFVYDVLPNTRYAVYGSKYPSTPTVVYMDANGEYIGHDGYDPNYTEWVAVDNNITVMTPSNCAKMVVQKLGLSTPPAAAAVTYENNLLSEVNEISGEIEKFEPVFAPDGIEQKSLSLLDGHYIGSDHVIYDISVTNYKITDDIPVNAGERIVITATVGYQTNMFYMFKNVAGGYVDGATADAAGTKTFYVTVPNGAYTLVVSAYNGSAVVGTVSSYKLKGKWTGKKWVCLGDSLTEVNSRTTLHYHDYVAEATGITVVNMGDSGSGYMNEQDLGTAFYQRAQNVPLDADVYTIFGSGNDLSQPLGTPTDTGTDTICGCVNATIDVLIGLKPTIQLGIVAPTPWVGNKPTLDDSNPMALYVKALKEICYIRSIPFLDLYHESNLRPWTAEGRAACYSKDNGGGVHPDEAGHKIIAPRFEGFLNTLLLAN